MMTQIQGISELFENDFKLPDERAPPRHEQHLSYGGCRNEPSSLFKTASGNFRVYKPF